MVVFNFLDQIIIMQSLGEGDEEKDLMIGWLLSKGANITSMEPEEVENYLDRCKSSCVGDRFILLIPLLVYFPLSALRTRLGTRLSVSDNDAWMGERAVLLQFDAGPTL